MLLVLATAALLCWSSPALTQSVDDSACFVMENTSGQKKACLFPFGYEGKEWNTCTTLNDPDGRAWCSTKVDSNGDHVKNGGFWGHCSQECIEETNDESLSETESESLDETLDFFESSLRQGFTDCPCQRYTTCDPVNQLVQVGRRLSRGDRRRQRIADALRNIRCGSQRGHFHCCPLPVRNTFGSTERPTVVTPKAVPTNGNGSPVDHTNENDGAYKPREGKDCGIRGRPAFIIGGTEAEPGDFPFAVLLGYYVPSRDRVFYTCGGTLINKFYVLTAAHCLTGKYKLTEIVLGEHDLSKTKDCDKFNNCLPDPQTRFPAETKLHEDWDQSKFQEGNDIALIRLDKPAILAFDDPTKSFLVPACLPWDSNHNARNIGPNERAIVVGWGRVTNNDPVTNRNYNQFLAASPTLQMLDVPVLDGQCKNDFNITSSIQVCAGGEPGKDSCGGDSGGPLIYRKGNNINLPWNLIGIVSFGTTPCAEGRAGVYTKVTGYLDWIERNLKP